MKFRRWNGKEIGIQFKKWFKRIVYVVMGFIGILFAAALFYSDESLEIEVCRPGLRTILEQVPANGKVRPIKEIRISPDVSGEIVEIPVEEGDWVERGSLLIKIKQDIYLSAVERAEALLGATEAEASEKKAQVVKLEKNLTRAQNLYAAGAISAREFEEAQAEYSIAAERLKSARFNIETARAELKESRENLMKTTIYAPASGYITKMYVELGERVVGTSQMAGTVMLCLADTREMEVVANLNENDLARIAQGDSACIRVDALQGCEFKGCVTTIACSPSDGGYGMEGAAGRGVYRVKILLGKSAWSRRLLPGMSASISIMAAKVENALSVPLQSVISRRGETFLYIYDRERERALLRPVVCGRQDYEYIEILSGVAPNEDVVCGPYYALSKELESLSYLLLKKE